MPVTWNRAGDALAGRCRSCASDSETSRGDRGLSMTDFDKQSGRAVAWATVGRTASGCKNVVELPSHFSKGAFTVGSVLKGIFFPRERRFAQARGFRLSWMGDALHESSSNSSLRE